MQKLIPLKAACWSTDSVQLEACQLAEVPDAEVPELSGFKALGLHHHVGGSGPPGLPDYLLPIMESGNKEITDDEYLRAWLPTPYQEALHP